MQAPKKIEEFAGQWILAMDPRAEKAVRACAACGSTDARSLGIKNELDILSCRKCASVYTPYSPWYSSEFYYDSYYKERLSPPAFVQTRSRRDHCRVCAVSANKPVAGHRLRRG